MMRGAARQRWREIEECLVAHGVGRGPRPLTHAPGGAGEVDHGRRLAAALGALGPSFTAFGLYLSTRVDLLPLPDCLALAALPEESPVVPAEVVWDCIARELGRDPGDVFGDFEAEPAEVHAPIQVHHARLRSGEEVALRVRCAEIQAGPARDRELLTVLRGALGSSDSAWPLERIVQDFRRAEAREADLLRTADLLNRRARSRGDRLRTPVVHQDLCTARLLVVERLAGVTLADLRAAASANPRGNTGRATAGAVPEVDRTDVASRLCRLWLYEALDGDVFAAVPRASEIVLLSGRQLAFTGPGFASLPGQAQRSLRDYLIAASGQDLEQACLHLLAEMEGGDRAGAPEEVLDGLRQVVPFRDGGWGAWAESETLAEHVALHVRLAGEHGFRVRPRSLDFVRSLVAVAGVAQAVAPAQDPLLEGLEDLRFQAAFGQFRGLFAPPQMGASAESYAAMLLELPRRLDQALTLAATGGRAPLEQRREVSREQGPADATFAVALVLGAVVAFSHQFSAAGAGAWAEKAAALAFLALGALLLRSVIGKE